MRSFGAFVASACIGLSTPSLGITNMMMQMMIGMIQGTFNSLSRDHRKKFWRRTVRRLAKLSTPSLGITGSLYLRFSRLAGQNARLSTPSLGITFPARHNVYPVPLKSFNSLSRDHSDLPGRKSGFLNRFQLPLSGSQHPEGPDVDLGCIEPFQLPLSGSHAQRK